MAPLVRAAKFIMSVKVSNIFTLALHFLVKQNAYFSVAYANFSMPL